MLELIEAIEVSDDQRSPTCADLDDDCPTVENPLKCWLYDMGRGRCPYCSSTGRQVLR